MLRWRPVRATALPPSCRASWPSRPDAPGSGFSAGDSEQDRNELIDLAHLVEEVVGARLHAALAHRRQVVVREHDDPDVPAVLRILVTGARLADHTDTAAGPQLDVYYNDVVGNRIEFFDRLGFGGREAGDLEGGMLREHVFQPAAQQGRVFHQQDAQGFTRRTVLAHRVGGGVAAGG